VSIPRRPFGFETPTRGWEGTGGSRFEPKYSHNSHLKESLNFAMQLPSCLQMDGEVPITLRFRAIPA
jgi:hypothetical protein